MGFADDEHISFKFSYGFFLPVGESPLMLGETGFDFKSRLTSIINNTYNLPEGLIDVCVNDYDQGGKGSYSEVSGNIFICLNGCGLEGEDIGSFSEIPNNVLNPSEESKNVIHQLAKIAGNKKCGFYIFAYSA